MGETCPVFASFPPRCTAALCILVLQELDQKQHIHFVLGYCETQFFSGGSDNPEKSSGYPITAFPDSLSFSDIYAAQHKAAGIARATKASLSTQTVQGGGGALMGHSL